jgi:hypothetical protein
MPSQVVITGKSVHEIMELLKEGLKSADQEKVKSYTPYEYAVAIGMLFALVCQDLGVPPSSFMKIAADFIEEKYRKPTLYGPDALALKGRVN